MYGDDSVETITLALSGFAGKLLFTYNSCRASGSTMSQQIMPGKIMPGQIMYWQIRHACATA
jgi:hypothetical protein